MNISFIIVYGDLRYSSRRTNNLTSNIRERLKK